MAKYTYKTITIITEDIINYYKRYYTVAEKQYSELINEAKLRIIPEDDGYYEKHHILPKSLGGLDDSENLVQLTYPEHVLAHMLLYAIHPDNYKLSHAFSLMCGKCTEGDSEIKRKMFSNDDEVIIGSGLIIDLKVLEKIRIDAIRNPERIEHMKQVQNSPEYLENQRKKTTERWKTKEYREKVLSKNREHWESPEYRKKQSNTLKEAWKDPEKRKIWQKSRNTEEYRQTLRNAREEVLSRPEFQEKMKKIRDSEDYKQHIREARAKTWEDDKYQAVFCKRVQGPDGEVCRSVKEASRIYGIPETTLTNWLRCKPEKGYKYITEDEYQSRKNN